MAVLVAVTVVTVVTLANPILILILILLVIVTPRLEFLVVASTDLPLRYSSRGFSHRAKKSEMHFHVFYLHSIVHLCLLLNLEKHWVKKWKCLG